MIRSTTPLCQISMSIMALSVPTPPPTSPRVTVSPALTSHSTMVPASMSAPSAGMRNSYMGTHRLARGRHDARRLGQRRVLQMLGIRNGHLHAAHARDGGVQIVEGLFRQPRRNLRGQAAAAPALV